MGPLVERPGARVTIDERRRLASHELAKTGAIDRGHMADCIGWRVAPRPGSEPDAADRSSVEAAVEPADGAGRDPALDVELEEAGAAVRAAEEPLGSCRAAAEPAHGGRPSDDGGVECSRKHVPCDPSCRDPMGGLDPGLRSWLLSVA